jgi:hypothetical protein
MIRPWMHESTIPKMAKDLQVKKRDGHKAGRDKKDKLPRLPQD